MATETIIFDVEIPPESITSIENLTKANKELRAERKKLDLESKEGQKRSQQINTQLDTNTDLIKKNSSALEKQRLNVGNYTGALDKMVPGLGATANGFGAMTKGAMAFIATPIGLVIAALGLILAGVMSYLKGTEEGQHKLNKIMNVGAAIIGKLTDALQWLGEKWLKGVIIYFEALGNVLSYIIPGFDKFVESVSKFLNLDAANGISDMEERLVLLNREMILKREILKSEIEDAKLRAESTKDLKERAAALKEVENKTKELFDKEREIAILQRDIAIEKGNLANNDIAANDAIEEAKARVFQVDKERAAALKENATKQIAINEANRIAAELELENIVKLANEENIREGNKVLAAAAEELRHQRELEQINERIQAYVSEEEQLKRRIASLDLEGDFVDESIEVNKDYVKSVQDSAKADQFAMAVTDAKMKLALTAADVLRTIGGENKIIAKAAILIEKAVAISQIVSSAAAANLKAIAVSPITFGQPWVGINSITAGLAVTGVVAQAAKSLGGFAEGGLSGTRINSGHGKSIRRSNGDNLLATVKTGEVILNSRQQALLGGDRVFRAAGVPGFDGGGVSGFSVASAASASDSRAASRELFAAISKIRPVVTVEDINMGQQSVDVVDQRAMVF